MQARLLGAAFALAPALLMTATPVAALGRSATPSPAPTASPTGTSTVKPSGTPAPDRVTFGLGAASKGNLDGRTAIQVVEPRGFTFRDQVAVVNLSLTPLTLHLYAVDVHNDVNGRLEPDVASQKPTDLGLWVTLDTPGGSHQIVVPAQGRLLVPISVHVPKNAPVGDHVAGIMVGLNTQAQGQGKTATNLNVEKRVGMQLSVRVAGQLTSQLSVTDMHVTYSGAISPFARGTAHVTYDIRNTGTVRLSGTQSLSIQGLLGSAAPVVDVPDVPMLLPGGVAAVSLDVPGVLPAGPLTADVTVNPQSAPGDADPPSQPATASTRFWAIDWTLLALIMLLVLGIAWFVRYRRRRPTPEPGRRVRGSTTPDLVGAGSARGRSS